MAADQGSSFNTVDAVLKTAAGLVVAEVVRAIENSKGAAESAGKAGVKAAIHAGAANLTDLRNQVASVLNDGISKLSAQNAALRAESERLRAAGSRPAVNRAYALAALAALAVGAGCFAGGWFAREAREAPALAWSMTTQGRLAAQMATQSPSAMHAILTCDAAGWHRAQQYGGMWCFPAPGPGIVGWRLPEAEK